MPCVCTIGERHSYDGHIKLSGHHKRGSPGGCCGSVHGVELGKHFCLDSLPMSAEV